MRIEEAVFQRRSVKREALPAFGFRQEGDVWHYSEPFMDGKFRADVYIRADGTVTGSVFDLDAGEVYLPVHIESRIGPYVGAVRQAYTAILERIAGACFAREPFLRPQTNRIARLILETYGEAPDFPFEKAPGCGVFRYPGNRKWYGLVMAIPKSRLEPGEKAGADSPVVEILNLKAGQERIPALLECPGFYPSYHMKQTNWVTVLLDGTVPDGRILELLAVSREFAVHAGGGAAARSSGASWIVPANPKYYDIAAAFRKSRDIIWKQSSRVRAGDLVYMYVAAPESAIRYKCRVLEADIPYSFRGGKVSMTHVMRIRLLETYPPDRFPFRLLNELGIRTIRGPRLAPPSFLALAEPPEA